MLQEFYIPNMMNCTKNTLNFLKLLTWKYVKIIKIIWMILDLFENPLKMANEPLEGCDSPFKNHWSKIC